MKKEKWKGEKKIKIYDLFFINISIKENKHLALNKFENEYFNTKIDKENSNQDSSSRTSKSEIDKIIHTQWIKNFYIQINYQHIF